jgi:cell division protein FtsQ
MKKSKFKVIKLRRKKKKSKKKFLTILIILFTLFTLNLVLFKVKIIEVRGSKNIDSDKIIKYSGIEKGKSMFLVLSEDLPEALNMRNKIAENRIKNNCFEVESVLVRIKFPNKVIINIKERVPLGYVVNTNTVLLIDKESMVIDILDNKDMQNFPIMQGVSFNNSKVGEKIKIKDDERFLAFKDIVLSIENADKNNGTISLMKKVKTVDVRDINKILLDLGNGLSVNLGTNSELAYKINLLQGMLEQFKLGEKGIIDYTLGENPVFVPK